MVFHANWMALALFITGTISFDEVGLEIPTINSQRDGGGVPEN